MHIHTIVLGLDVLGNPVNVVRGVVEGTFDLFYEPIKVTGCYIFSSRIARSCVNRVVC